MTTEAGGNNKESASPGEEEPPLAWRPRDVEDELGEAVLLHRVYGRGAALLRAHSASGAVLSPKPNAVPTCLRASRSFTLGRGLGFESDRREARQPTRFGVEPPLCVSCELERWPASKSGKGKWHCGYCSPPPGGRPRCHKCSALTWDGWSAPATHGHDWWCAACWGRDPEEGHEVWDDWFERRRGNFFREFADGGPDLSPPETPPTKRKASDCAASSGASGPTPCEGGSEGPASPPEAGPRSTARKSPEAALAYRARVLRAVKDGKPGCFEGRLDEGGRALQVKQDHLD